MAKKESKKARKRRLKEEAKLKANPRRKKIAIQSDKPKYQKEKINLVKLWPIAAILIASFVIFSPSLENEFVNWDDDKNFYENLHITSLNQDNFWENTKKIFTTPVIGNYNPLSIWSFAIEQRLFGLDQPMYWHLNNILLHLVCVLFVYLIGSSLGLGKFGTIIFTLLFAIHPLRVESVTWVTERKDVLFGAFYLAALYYYIKSYKFGKNWKYSSIIWICFILSLFSKIQAVILPVSFVLVDYYFSGKISVKGILKKWPYFLASLAFGILGIYFLKDQGSLDTADTYAGVSRIFVGAFSVIVYFIKSIIPYELSPLYPYPTKVPWYFYPSIISFIALGWYLWTAYKKDWRVGFFGIGFFLANIFFLLQILGAGQGFIADRFSYISFIGINFIYAYYLSKLIEWRPNTKYFVYGISAVILLGYSFLTYNQTKIWKDSESLWTHVLKYYDKITLPFGNRANFRRDKSQDLEAAALQAQQAGNTTLYQQLKAESNRYVNLALKDYGETIRLKPNEAGPYNSRARLYFNFTQRDSLLKALQNYNKAIELKPDEDEYWINRGATYAKLGDYDNALTNLNRGIELDPNFQNGYLNRSVIYNMRGQYAESLRDIDSFLRLRPYDGDIWYECGRLRYILGRHQESLVALDNAIRYGGNKGVYFYQKSRTHYALGDFANAKNFMNKSIQLGYRGDANATQEILSR